VRLLPAQKPRPVVRSTSDQTAEPWENSPRQGGPQAQPHQGVTKRGCLTAAEVLCDHPSPIGQALLMASRRALSPGKATLTATADHYVARLVEVCVLGAAWFEDAAGSMISNQQLSLKTDGSFVDSQVTLDHSGPQL
jgi:hypothetical protein